MGNWWQDIYLIIKRILITFVHFYSHLTWIPAVFFWLVRMPSTFPRSFTYLLNLCLVRTYCCFLVTQEWKYIRNVDFFSFLFEIILSIMPNFVGIENMKPLGLMIITHHFCTWVTFSCTIIWSLLYMLNLKMKTWNLCRQRWLVKKEWLSLSKLNDLNFRFIFGHPILSTPIMNHQSPKIKNWHDVVNFFVWDLNQDSCVQFWHRKKLEFAESERHRCSLLNSQSMCFFILYL